MEIGQDFKEFIELLNKYQVSYLVAKQFLNTDKEDIPEILIFG